MLVFNRTKGLPLIAEAGKADTFMTRLLGLIPRAGLKKSEGLWLEPCAMIHTCFMRFSIDAVFLDGNKRVLKAVRRLKPWRSSPWVRGAKGVLETAAGATEGLVEEGDVLEFRFEKAGQ